MGNSGVEREVIWRAKKSRVEGKRRREKERSKK